MELNMKLKINLYSPKKKCLIIDNDHYTLRYKIFRNFIKIFAFVLVFYIKFALAIETITCSSSILRK